MLRASRTLAVAARAALPRLPLPKLQDMQQRYSETIRPLVSAEEHAESTKLLDEFVATDAVPLQRDLEAIAASSAEYPGSFVEQYWDDMYLNGRWALPINSNPALLLQAPDERDAEARSQLNRATRAILSSVPFAWRALRDELVQTPGPLDMVQYKRMFGSTRIPRRGRDVLQTAALNDCQHIVVLRGTQMYRVRVMDDRGGVVSEAALRHALAQILNGSAGGGSDLPPISALTSLERDRWASLREQLEQSPVNRASLRAIDTALFAITLDEAPPRASPLSDADRTSHLLHGVGSSGECYPRWFDKSVHLIVHADGHVGLNFEHSWGDGACIGRYLHELHEAMRQPHTDQGALSTTAAEPLRWDLDADLRAAARAAHEELAAAAGNVATAVRHFDAFGKDAIKSWSMSPDSFVQMAFQLAAWRLHHETLPTYESCNMQHFHRGRTEAIRSTSMASVAMTTAWSASDADARARLLRAAVARHNAIAKDAREGRGVDRHLFALLSRGKELGRPTHLFFQSAGYQRLNANLLSTSTVSVPCLKAASFGPVNADGYGIAYIIRDGSISLNVTSFNSSAARRSQPLADEIAASLNEFAAIASR